jgi:hypothetical protein
MKSKPSRPGHFHAVRFYESPDALSRIVADFIADGLAQSLPGVLIASPEHLALVEAQLHARGFDLDRLKANDDLIMADAETHLTTFMVDGTPHPQLFRDNTVPLLERARQGRSDCVIRAYGEMVDILWQAGHTIAATRLEMLWNELAGTHDFSLMCGYAMGHFYKHVAADDVLRLHSHVVSATGEAARIH